MARAPYRHLCEPRTDIGKMASTRATSRAALTLRFPLCRPPAGTTSNEDKGLEKRVGVARFIVIDKGTGRVYGDTARFGRESDVIAPADAVCLFDRQVDRAPRGLGYVSTDSIAASYDVYEVPRPGPGGGTTSEGEAHDLVCERGSLVTGLVTYNS